MAAEVAGRALMIGSTSYWNVATCRKFLQHAEESGLDGAFARARFGQGRAGTRVSGGSLRRDQAGDLTSPIASRTAPTFSTSCLVADSAGARMCRAGIAVLESLPPGLGNVRGKRRGVAEEGVDAEGPLGVIAPQPAAGQKFPVVAVAMRSGSGKSRLQGRHSGGSKSSPVVD